MPLAVKRDYTQTSWFSFDNPAPDSTVTSTNRLRRNYQLIEKNVPEIRLPAEFP